MTGRFEVVQPGLHTTVQDLGRTGHQSQGIPVSGAVDATALRAANIVVGNAEGAAGLEMALTGPTLRVAEGRVRVAVAGGTAQMIVADADGHEVRRVKPLESVSLETGWSVRVAAITDSAVAYLAFCGGLDVPAFLDSRSTYVRGGFGGLEGRAIKTGDRIGVGTSPASDGPEMQLDAFELLPPRRAVRVVLGPQDDYFTQAAIATFLSAEYVVTRDADRMGLRLDGPTLAHAKGANIISDGIAPGAIQVPGNGCPIVLLVDRQTTGGYPKIATVISADLPALGRVAPGARLRFEAISVQAAQAVRRVFDQEMRSLAGRRTAVRPTGLDVARLYEENLVSGVADAHHRHADV